MGCMGVCILRHLKEELAWATNRWLQIISSMLFKTVILLCKELKNKFKTVLDVLLCGLSHQNWSL